MSLPPQRHRRVILGLLFAAAYASFTAAAHAQDDPSQYSAGDCGGIMRGYDGRGYQCEAIRRPVCQLSTGRCVCLLRRDCGGDRDEPW